MSSTLVSTEVVAEKTAVSIRRAIADAQAARPQPLSDQEGKKVIGRIKQLLEKKNAVLVAHYYVDSELQDLADETGGCVADSLDMARFGYAHPAQTVVVAGVRFMGETAKILSPEKKVLMVDRRAECSLDLGCPTDAFSEFCAQHPDRTVVVYANTSAAVKARADWAVTSSIALKVTRHLDAQGKNILWAPDKFLGGYIQRQTGADMLLWQGSCVVHEDFKATAMQALMKQHPDAVVLVHPESPGPVIELADVVGSTSQIIKAAQEMEATRFIVATEQGILHKMRQRAPGKILMPAPTAGEGATCESCAVCPWMKMNSLQRLLAVLERDTDEIQIDESIRARAETSIRRMVEFGHNADPDSARAA